MVDKVVRDRLRSISDAARGIVEHRQAVRMAAERAADALAQRLMPLSGSGASGSFIPLGTFDLGHAASVERLLSLPRVDQEADSLLRVLSTGVPTALDDDRRGSGLRAIFAGGERRAAAARAEEYLTQTASWIEQTGASWKLQGVDDRTRPSVTVPLTSLASPFGALASATSAHGLAAPLDLRRIRRLPALLRVLDDAVASERAARTAVETAGQVLRDATAQQELDAMDIDRLRDVTRDQLRLGALRDVGVTTVGTVLRHPLHARAVAGIGETTATRINAAARSLQAAARQDSTIRITANERNAESESLVGALRRWEAAKSGIGARDRELVEGLRAVSESLTRGASLALVFGTKNETGSTTASTDVVQRIIADADEAERRADNLAARQRPSMSSGDWQDFLDRPATYFALLEEAGLTKSTPFSSRGDLPNSLIEQVEQFQLDTSRLSASLRGYQRFGAAFALVQGRVVIGDEMGLGKTVEALAVFAHLAAAGGLQSRHFLVICPAAVVANWVRETEKHTDVRAFRLHGPERVLGIREWAEHGGVAVTTFETLQWFRARLADDLDLAAVVVDEAHYVKNPDAKRTQNTRELVRRAERVVLMSGTPLENRVDEFRVLIDHIRPELVLNQTDDSPMTFRKQVAPVYLRRSQEDVLTELPDLVEVEEWTNLTPSETHAYADAVDSGNFHAMRQLAMLDGTRSSKVESLLEIVDEARANGRKVLVFSHYRAVLDVVRQVLGGSVFGPLNGATSASARQEMVDDFSAAEPGAVLVAQILAGGVGLNIQAASVVVICEPQLKPTTEWQAIARSRRMGQLQSVQVHRLLSEDGVDAALLRMLARKKQTFDDFAAVSETANASTQAFDISESSLIARVLDDERRRLGASLAQVHHAPERVLPVATSDHEDGL